MSLGVVSMNKLFTIYDTIKSNGYKITNHRKEIIRVLMDNNEYLLDASDIYEKLIKVNKEINFSTVYRNIEMLTKIGIIKKNNLENGKSAYQLVIGDKHGHQLICKACGKVKTINDCPFEKIDKEVFDRNDFMPDSHKFEIYGFCKKCLNERCK